MVLDYHRVFINDVEVSLSRVEFNILCYLLKNRGIILKYEQIYNHAYDDDYYDVSPGILFSAMKRLRKKIQKLTKVGEYIENVREIGYRIPTKFIQKN
jgi:DNA-binding response OmpR family regulator